MDQENNHLSHDLNNERISIEDAIMNASKEEFDRLSFMVEALIENCQQSDTIESLLLELHVKDQTIERLHKGFHQKTLEVICPVCPTPIPRKVE